MAVAAPSRLNVYLQLIRWDRPIGTFLLLWPTLSALWIAAHGFPGWHRLAVFALGTFLMRSAGCVVNDVADRNIDKHVQRTAQRPVTTGAIGVRPALALGGALALLAFGLVLTTNALTVWWSGAALAVSIAYPFTKRFFAMPQAVLGVAFGMGIPMAFAAVQGQVPVLAWQLALGNMCWVLAYDTEYAMVDREDDLRLGVHTSAITLGRWDVCAIVLFYVLYIAIWTWTGLVQGLRWPYFVGLGIAAVLALDQYRLIRSRTRIGCFRAFQRNHWLGLAVWCGVALAYLH
jgi:4-hydroxybenzoate polyprenyltransferase